MKLKKQGITNMLALPIDKMLNIYLLCSHSEHPKNPFQPKQSKRFHSKNWFTECETGLNSIKLPKVGSNAIVPVPVGAGPNKIHKDVRKCKLGRREMFWGIAI